MTSERPDEIQLDCNLGGSRLQNLHAASAYLAVSLPCIHGPLSIGWSTVRLFHRGIQLLPRRPRTPVVEVVNQNKNLLWRRLHICGALYLKRVRLRRSEAE